MGSQRSEAKSQWLLCVGKIALIIRLKHLEMNCLPILAPASETNDYG